MSHHNARLMYSILYTDQREGVKEYARYLKGNIGFFREAVSIAKDAVDEESVSFRGKDGLQWFVL